MVRIAICDDLQEQLDIIQKAVQQYFHDKKEPTEVFTYNNAMDFVDAFEKEGNFDIVLLDICMPGLLGTDIAAEMRKQKSRAEIVFLSTSEEFAVEAFAVRAAHYLVKPFTQKEFDQAMDRVMESIRQRHSGKMIFRLVGGGIQVEEVNAILYVESNGHIQQVYTADHLLLETRQSLAVSWIRWMPLRRASSYRLGKAISSTSRLSASSRAITSKSRAIRFPWPSGNIASSRKVI